MIVRSISDARQPRHEERRRNRHQDRERRCGPGISQLHDVGRVGAEHHQLAVRHVDDAHDAERDRQADGDQHQHRAQAQAEEQRLDARIERAPASRCAATAAAAAVPHRLRRFRRSCRRRTSRAARASRLRTSWLHAGCEASRSPSSRALASAPSSAASARPVAISLLDRRHPSPLPSRSRSSATRRRRRATAIMSRTASSRTAASGLDSAKCATAIRSVRRSRLFVPILVRLSARRGCRRPSAISGSIRSSDGIASSADLTMKTF